MNADRHQEPDRSRASDTLSNLAGLYALTSDGTVGSYGEKKAFVPDEELTAALAAQVRQLLDAHLADPRCGRQRVALLYRSPEPRAWRSDTLFLEEAVVRELYPVGGPSNQELTVFQRKNREKSIYRGIELMLDYRYDTASDDPVYCPLLFDRGTTLDEYASTPGAAAGTAPIPVLEVLNLASMFPLGRRNHPALAALLERMRQYLIHKDMRRDEFLSLREQQYVGAPSAAGGGADYFDADKRHEREGAWPPPLRAAAQAQEAERFDQVERWLERPVRPVDPALLRGFAQFRELAADRLTLLAQRAFVYTAPAGVRLLNVGMTDSWNMYLLEGTLSLEAADGKSLFVTGGTPKASSPVAFLKPRKYTATTVTPVSFLWIHDALLAAVLVHAPPTERPGLALKPNWL